MVFRSQKGVPLDTNVLVRQPNHRFPPRKLSATAVQTNIAYPVYLTKAGRDLNTENGDPRTDFLTGNEQGHPPCWHCPVLPYSKRQRGGRATESTPSEVPQKRKTALPSHILPLAGVCALEQPDTCALSVSHQSLAIWTFSKEPTAQRWAVDSTTIINQLPLPILRTAAGHVEPKRLSNF